MPVQMIELEEVAMVEASDDSLESMVTSVARWGSVATGGNWCYFSCNY